jgi:hypothetical protein
MMPAISIRGQKLRHGLPGESWMKGDELEERAAADSFKLVEHIMK